MPPPELPGDAPVADIICPVEVDLLHSLRKQPDLSVLYSLHSGLYQSVHLYEPLLLHQRLHRRPAAGMGSHIVRGRPRLYKQPEPLKLFQQSLSARIAVHPLIFPGVRVHRRVIIYDSDLRQTMAFPHLKIIRVMGRCDFHTSCPEFHVDIRICNYRNLTAGQRQL